MKLSTVDLIKTDQNNKIFPGWWCFQVLKDVLGSQSVESWVPVIPYHGVSLASTSLPICKASRIASVKTSYVFSATPDSFLSIK